MAKIKIYHDFSGIAQDIIAIWYKNSAPLAEVGRLLLNAPHVSDNFLIEDLDPVMHMVKFYQTADGVTPGAQRAYIDVDAGLYNEAAVDLIEFTVGSGVDVGDGVHTSPADSAVSYRNDNLASGDVTGYVVNKPGYGELSSANIVKDPAGGFDLIDGSIFSQDETYSITVYKLITGQVQQTTTQNQFLDIVVITGDVSFDSDYRNKLLIAEFAVGLRSIFLPALSSIPDNTILHVNTHGSTFPLNIECDGSDTIQFLGEARTTIYLGRGEEIRIAFKGGAGYIVHYDGDARRLGQRIWGDKVELNTLVRDGSAYLLADYPRLAEWIDSLGAGQVVSYSDWALSQSITAAGITRTMYPNKGLFAISPDGLSFKVPDDRNLSIRALKNLGGADAERLTNIPGGLQAGSANVKVNDMGGQGGVDPGTNTGLGYSAGNPSFYQFKNRESIYGSETRPDNIGLIPLIVI